MYKYDSAVLKARKMFKYDHINPIIDEDVILGIWETIKIFIIKFRRKI